METEGKQSLRKGVENKITEQLQKNAARKIVSLIQSWQIKAEEASRRWVWELLQNAVDTAERCQRSFSATFKLESQVLVYEHDAGPFLDEEIAALLLAGSAKPFDNSPYAGRFGTGFFVTHAISPMVILTGTAEGYPGGFRLTLDRRGKEEDIQRSIEAGKRELEKPVNSKPGLTRFEYHELSGRGVQVGQRGLAILDNLLPYVFAFNRWLREVSIAGGGLNAVWQRTGESAAEGVNEKAVSIVHLSRMVNRERSHVDVYVSSPCEGALAAAVIRLGPQGRELAELLPESPRAYRNFPLLESEWTGLPVVVHAAFDVDEDRSALFIANEGPEDGGDEDVTAKNQALAIRIVRGLAPFVSYIARLNDVKRAHWATGVCGPKEKFAQATRWRLALRDLGTALLGEEVVRVQDQGSSYVRPNQCVFLKPIAGRMGTGTRVDPRGFWSLASRLGRPFPSGLPSSHRELESLHRIENSDSVRSAVAFPGSSILGGRHDGYARWV